ncbi:MAG: A24 family peptidase [Oscillospiraceae bacterium]
MDIFLKAILLLSGAALGYELTDISQRLAQYKYRKKGLPLNDDPRFTALPAKLGLCVLNAAAWFLSGLLTDNFLIAALVSVLLSTALLTALVDIRIRIIPNELLLIMIVLGLAFQAVQFGLAAIMPALLCMAAMMLLFSAVAGFVGFDKVGAGDVKLAGAMGFALGYPVIISGLVIMSAVFVIFTLAGLLTKRLTLKTMVPFAPFMMTGMVFALIYAIY